MFRALGLVPLIASMLVAACSADGPPIESFDPSDTITVDLAKRGIVRIGAAPGRGFNYPYLLYWPGDADPTAAPRRHTLLVLPNNTGTADDDLAVHESSAIRLARSERRLADDLGQALLVPIFPRPQDRWRIYTHALDRDVMTLAADDPLSRPDLQLLAMVDHARAVLADNGRTYGQRILLFGYSASASFADRFTALHPERVAAVAAGGLNALPILPLAELEGHALPYPIGVGDLHAINGHPFDLRTWRQVPRFVFMGSDDDNDTLPYDDAWSDDERALISSLLGQRMQPDRWRKVQDLLGSDSKLTLRTYAGRGHEIDAEIRNDIHTFLRQNAGVD